MERSLAVLRRQLVRRGVALSTGALALTLSAHAVSAAPPVLSASLAAASLAGARLGSPGVATTWLQLLAMSKMQIVTLGLVFTAGLLTPALRQSRANPRAAVAPGSTPGLQATDNSQPIQPLIEVGRPGERTIAGSDPAPLRQLEEWLRKTDRTDPRATGIEDELQVLLWSLPASEYAAAWELRRFIHSIALRQSFQSGLLDFWSQTEPSAAVAAAQLLPPAPTGVNAVGNVLEHWANSHLDAALAWAQQSRPESARAWRMCQVLTSVARKDPLLALGLLEQIPSPGIRSITHNQVYDVWSSRDPAAVVAYVAKTPASTERDHQLQYLLGNWAKVDPTAAQKWATETGVPAP